MFISALKINFYIYTDLNIHFYILYFTLTMEVYSETAAVKDAKLKICALKDTR